VHAVGGNAQGGSRYKTDPGSGGGVSCAVCAGPEQRRDTTAANGEALTASAVAYALTPQAAQQKMNHDAMRLF